MLEEREIDGGNIGEPQLWHVQWQFACPGRSLPATPSLPWARFRGERARRTAAWVLDRSGREGSLSKQGRALHLLPKRPLAKRAPMAAVAVLIGGKVVVLEGGGTEGPLSKEGRALHLLPKWPLAKLSPEGL